MSISFSNRRTLPILTQDLVEIWSEPIWELMGLSQDLLGAPSWLARDPTWTRPELPGTHLDLLGTWHAQEPIESCLVPHRDPPRLAWDPLGTCPWLDWNPVGTYSGPCWDLLRTPLGLDRDSPETQPNLLETPLGPSQYSLGTPRDLPEILLGHAWYLLGIDWGPFRDPTGTCIGTCLGVVKKDFQRKSFPGIWHVPKIKWVSVVENNFSRKHFSVFVVYAKLY